jgi:uncharacterized HAD superfamily protein
MSKIAIDIDETLYSFDSAVRDAFFQMAIKADDKSILRLAYSNNHEWRNLVDHDAKLAYEAIEIVHTASNSYQSFPDAPWVVEEIAEAGHEIIYVGSRKQEHWHTTKEFLDWNNFPEGELICADPSKSKLEYIQDCQYLIDDRPKTILEFLYTDKHEWDFQRPDEGPRKAFALWRPYNQNLTEVPNLYLAPTWRGLEYYLKRKGVINGSLK